MLRMEIACILILVFIAGIYFTSSRERSSLHKIFSGILVTLTVHLIFDAITITTVAKLDTFPRFWNDTFHRIFLSTMLLTIYLYYRYICELIKQETGEAATTKRHEVVRRILDGYLIIAQILLYVTPVTYEVTPKGNYESGIGAIIIYASIAVFLIHMVSNMAVHWKAIQMKKRIAIVSAFAIEIVVTTLTMIDTSLLLAGMGLTMIAVSFYLVLENPDIKLVEQIREEKRKVEEANASKSTFLSVVSHEIRTPMNAIVGMADILLAESRSEQENKYLRSIKTSGDSLLMIVNDLLDQSKIEAGKMELIESVYELDSLLQEVQLIIENRIDNKPICVKVEVDKKIPNRLVGDRLRIRQILINIMNNAVKFTKEGSITLSIRKVSDTPGGMKLYYSVKDTGQGIRKEDLSKLFMAFSQVNQEENHAKEGTGLGLSISRDFIRMMGGELSVASEFGKGSEFFFEIEQKLPGEEEKAKEEIQRKKLQNLQNFTAMDARILLVDDTAINQKVVKGLLKGICENVDTAESGQEAIDKMESDVVYDLVFMDYFMPYMDGIQATRTIRGLAITRTDRAEYYAKVPIIALSADTMDETIIAFEQAGMNGHIEKPVTKAALQQSLLKWLSEDKIRME